MNKVLESPSDSPQRQKHLNPRLVKSLVLATALCLAFLRVAPAFTFQAGNDRVFLGFPYSIEDTLQYADFVAQAKDHGSLFLSNRFTLDHESPRLIILPIYLIGQLAATFDMQISTAWSISQALLIICFVLLWYWFVGFFFKDTTSRLLAFSFVLIAGGLDGWVVLFSDIWPQAWVHVLKRDLWVVLGWTPYMTMYNPLYLAGWIALLAWLGLVKKSFDAGGTWPALLAAIGLPLIYLVHAYDSAVAILTLTFIPLHALLIRFDTKAFFRALRTSAIIGIGIIPVACIAWWQSKDPLFAKVASEGQSGMFVSPDMWLLGFGGIFLTAMYGMSNLGNSTTRASLLFGWLTASALLSFSPLFEGRHFLYFVSLPLGLVAVDGLLLLKNKIAWTRKKKVVFAVVIVLIFGNSFIRTTQRAFTHPYKDPRMTISKSELAMAKRLRALPPGGVLASRKTCLWLPHICDHRCVMGHWFLTWDMAQKMSMFKRLVSGRISPEATDVLLKKFGAKYLFWSTTESTMGSIPRPARVQLLPLAKTNDTILYEIRTNPAME